MASICRLIPALTLTLGALIFPKAKVFSASTPAPERKSDYYSSSSAMGSGSFRSVLSPALDIPLSSLAAGVVQTIHVREGSRVTANQRIISLDSNQEKADLAQAEASLQGAKADMDRAAAELERSNALKGVLSDKQILEAQAQADITSSRYKQMAAAVDGAKVRLANRDIVSPVDGIFFKTNKVVGESVERYEPVARIIDVTTVEMVVFCDARYFSLFKEGQKVDVKVLKSEQDQPTVSGTISHVDPIIDPSSGTFRVKVKIQPSPEAVPGFPAVLIAPSLS